MLEFIQNLYNETFVLPDEINIVIFIYGGIEILTFSAIFLYLPFHILFKHHGQQRFLSFLFLTAFWILKVFYFPLFISLNPRFNVNMPQFITIGSMFVLFFGYIFFGILPLVFSIIYYVKFYKNSKSIENYPIVDVIMPIYNETEEDLVDAIKSILSTDYRGKVNIYCSFDDDSVSGLYFAVVNRFVKNNRHYPKRLVCKNTETNRSMMFLRNPHGGKKNAQSKAWEYIHENNNTTNSYILYVDSDITMNKDCITNFVKYMEHNKTVGAATGVVSLKSSTFWNLLHHYQLPEYIAGQIITRSTESFLGGITCCPGALTMIRKNVMEKVADKYFCDIDTQKLLSYHRFHLGEDRYFTHLLLEETKCGLVLNAYVETVGITKWSDFMKQRRRWLLGAISNEGWMISSFSLWRKYPLMLFFKSMEFCNRFLSVYSIVYMVRYLLFPTKNNYTQFIYFTPILIQILMLTVWGIKYKKYSIGIAYFCLIPIMPFVQTIVYCYSIFSFRKRSWGGPRTDDSYDKRETMDMYV